MQYAVLGFMVLNTPSIQSSCFQSVSSTPCGSPGQSPAPLNACLGRSYSPTESSYCDSRDGECGTLNCDVQTVYVTMTIDIYDIIKTPGQGDRCGEFLYSEIYEVNETCNVATLSGDQCGECNPG